MANVGDNRWFYPYYGGWYNGKSKPGYWAAGPPWVVPAGLYGGAFRRAAGAASSSSDSYDMTTTTTISSTNAQSADATNDRLDSTNVVGGGIILQRKLEESVARGLRGSTTGESFVVGAEGVHQE